MDELSNSKDENENSPKMLQVLEALKQASHDLQHDHHHHSNSNSPSIKALLELQTESDNILSSDPNLSTLSQHLTRLKSLVDTLNCSNAHLSLRSFLTRRISTHSISRVAGSIETEIQAWIHRESVETLSRTLRDPNHNPDELVTLLTQFDERVSHGFNRKLQDLVLKFKIFSSLENILFDPKCCKGVREHAGEAVAALIQFNKDVFVGQVSMGSTILALMGMSSLHSIEVLCSLIRLIRSPFVDEIESNGEIPKILALLNSNEIQIRVLAMDCVLEIGYFGRKETVDAMMKEGLVKKLVELQRSEVGGDLIELNNDESEEKNEEGEKGKRENMQKRFLEKHPFASCVARFAMQLEIGEGLRQREKRAFKIEILTKVREASVSDAEYATIVAEILWCSSL
ncbi:hypothetical protein Lal_00040789 [Lupinus albus]|uniref:Uncharacterized protein n=1 Tax=Lupinus albus TaxID=3870 RepID=A0A6A4PJR1_LUPAL|nr:hypothetical protein Lalb_Chr13g0301421 [Lupinus albus]KAF1887189.1 hypothetical protein Lal_00040789 [Lupinus albus]